MRKIIIPIFIFCLLFLLCPIRVEQYYDAGELAIRYVWIPFGGVHILLNSSGEMSSANNTIILIIISLIGSFTSSFFLNKRTAKK